MKPAIPGTSCLPKLQINLKIKYVTVIRLNHIAEKSLRNICHSKLTLSQN